MVQVFRKLCSSPAQQMAWAEPPLSCWHGAAIEFSPPVARQKNAPNSTHWLKPKSYRSKRWNLTSATTPLSNKGWPPFSRKPAPSTSSSTTPASIRNEFLRRIACDPSRGAAHARTEARAHCDDELRLRLCDRADARRVQ